MTPLLEVTNLARYFPAASKGAGLRFGRRRDALLHAVDGVSFQIGLGETVGLVGESGCGKSTLARIVARLLDPSAGSILLNGRDIGAVPARRFGTLAERAQIQMVFQDAGDSLNPRYTAADAIADPLRRLRRLRGARLKQRVEALTEMCGLPPELLTRFPHQLSGGQRARVGIARAIAVEPRLLVLDEPTSALDASVQVVILRLLVDLRNKLDMSYLFVSHDLNVVRLLCDRVLVMYLGKIAESGPTEMLFRAAAHPYTRLLVSAIPSFEPGTHSARLSAPGEPRSPIDPDPKVCRFYGRCPIGQVRCHSEMPLLAEMGGGRRVACHFPHGGAGHDTGTAHLRVVA